MVRNQNILKHISTSDTNYTRITLILHVHSVAFVYPEVKYPGEVSDLYIDVAYLYRFPHDVDSTMQNMLHTYINKLYTSQKITDIKNRNRAMLNAPQMQLKNCY